MAEAFLGLGGNIGDSRPILGRAVSMLTQDGTLKLLARSSDYITPPWGMKYQAPFVNLCLAVETALEPLELLDFTQDIELRLGRDRLVEKRWGPRTADIDILAYDDVAMSTARLILPHPLMFERAFVLIPLAEIAADRVIDGKAVKTWATEVDAAGIQKLPVQ
ncbi:MAG: 2-amino-4-hydroxy-6-hydroxymethyldihydropteridine diphosphokinase [Pseudolabrys sp.]|nr:2-amino-4-hydroxy-6-hydroxymethyldihydropteridine diphosphokinase [Pseudolabrys sp.]